jgi:hypothetical protein
MFGKTNWWKEKNDRKLKQKLKMMKRGILACSNSTDRIYPNFGVFPYANGTHF